jgi:uncharacterized membrane protein YedE/YeeE
MQFLPDRLPWYLAGPMIGMLVVLTYAIANQRMGVTGSYVEVAALARGQASRNRWRVWFFAGLGAGSVMAVLLRGGSLSFNLGYGVLGAVLPLGVLVPVLFAGGLLMGYGARWGGGCTSGHGISGTASRSPASFAATATFMATAIAVTLAVHWATGGAL